MDSAAPAAGGAAAGPRWGWLLRWLPRGMAGQIFALLLAGLLLTHLVGVWVMSRDHGEIHPIARRESLREVAQMVRAAQALAPRSELGEVLALFDGPQGRFRVVDGPPAEGPHAPIGADADMAADLRAALGLPADAVQVRIDEGMVPPPEIAAQLERLDQSPQERVRLNTWVRLDAQRWLASEQWPQLRRRWWWPMSFWLQISLLPVVLVAGLAARRLLGPSRALVQAAGRISRGERVEPLAVQGPQEMRDILHAFNEMQDRLHRFVDDRTRMLAAIGHDFRTPITSLRLRVEMVDDPALRAAMVRTLDGMRAMIDETLRFAQDDAAHEATQTVALAELVDAVLQEHAALGHDVRWALPGPQPAVPPVRCRPMALQRALANILDNAVHYGLRARVQLTAETDAVRIVVDDDGPGIPEAAFESAFAPFTRLHDAARQAADAGQASGGHAGLGLSIARSCVRAHGGDIVLSRAPSGGLRVQIVLPR